MREVPGKPERFDDKTQVWVTIARPFAVGQFAVTFDERDACTADGGCVGYNQSDDDWTRGRRPVIHVSWDDAQYVTRAGTTTPFRWGPPITSNQANYDGRALYNGGRKGEYRQLTVPVDSFSPNPWGLYNVHGDVWEWTKDCGNESNNGNQETTLQEQLVGVFAESSAAVPGTTIRGTSARPTGSGSSPSAGATMTASASRGRSHPKALDLTASVGMISPASRTSEINSKSKR
jgi:formylglycine-generating enzyme required for sulfatase activity